jgi:hypothetical protein
VEISPALGLRSRTSDIRPAERRVFLAGGSVPSRFAVAAPATFRRRDGFEAPIMHFGIDRPCRNDSAPRSGRFDPIVELKGVHGLRWPVASDEKPRLWPAGAPVISEVGQAMERG